ncbi:N-6 DNA methylase [Psychrobacter okhotskensis]|uniref:Eco57I restriction-modification methylase domain-containing protein n=1 Tax=Psychrobacter okhotskensis TaxID=212403 RepID=UPI0015667429|nr:N-6 DNA methylase [Psychrobacter okhotskensis]NRD69645.1 N-6 DNA methylase [Psychrobacter okhotskensis]
MSLFQSIVIEKYVRELDNTQLETAWQTYSHCFLNLSKQDNIRLSKEEQYQEGFLRDLFVDVFGYTLNPNPNYDLTTEFKNQTSSKKADGAILKDGHAIGVVELKGMNTTDLSKIEQQAFGYKNNQPQCRYVITSNFQKLRLYIDNAVEFIEFDLFTMTQDKFALLYLLLHRDGVMADLPAKIKSESLSQEEAITKQLYRDYSVFKRELFADLTAKNPDIDALILFQKSQKLLDRLLFIFFAEDSHLLPANFAKGIISEWEQLKALKRNEPLYDQVKQYFSFLDNGYKDEHCEIFAYNGGLFRPDELLDKVIISDELLRSHILILSEYNFASEVDVNILGHIFENSLTELDEVKAVLAGEVVDKAQTKRKKDGVFYTPKYITKYIVENTVGKLCEDKKLALALNDEDYEQDITINKSGKKRKKTDKRIEEEKVALDRLNAYRDWLLQITICDPAVGSGAFLNEALNFLIAEHEYIVELETKLFGSGLAYPDIENSILENNLFGVDINEESVEIAKLSLWLRTAQPRRKLNNLNDNIQCGNSLIDDVEVAGDKAFNWQTAFPQVFAKGGFDVVIGNPPYLRIQGLQSAYPEMVSYYEKQFESAMGNYDIYVLFIERSLDLIKETGQVSLILPHKFLISEFGEGVRRLLAENKLVASLLHFEEHLVFEVTTYTCILTLNKMSKNELQFSFINPQKIQEMIEWTSLSYDELTHEKWNLLSDTEINLFEKLHKQPLTAKDVFSKIFVGLQTSADKIFLIDGHIEGNLVKGYSKSLGCEVEIEAGLMKPLLKGQDVARYKSLINENFVLFPYSIDSDGKAKSMTENEVAQNFPLGYQYLKANEVALRGREKGRFNEPNQWYLFGRKQGINEVEQSKIITPEISLGCNMSFDVGSMYHNTKCYSFILDKPSDLAYKFYLSVLNSKILWFFLSNTGYVLRGGYFTFKTNYLYPFPLPKLPDNAKYFSQKADLMLSLNEQLQNSTGKFVRTLQRKFDIDKLSKKLENWHELTYAEFIKELGKKKIKMSLGDEAEWEEYFLAEQTKAKQLIAEIERTDREIDQMVYKLYDLTDAEIAIIEAS